MGGELQGGVRNDHQCRCPDDESMNLMHVAYIWVLKIVALFAGT